MCSWRARARPSGPSPRFSRRPGRGASRRAKIPDRNAVRGARIIFAGSDGAEKTLYYFSTDLSNSGVKASGFLKFCAALGPGNSLIKSASYLLHSGNFTTVRDFILNNSATIIQDDSGIPLAYYSPKKWRLVPIRTLCSDRSANSRGATSDPTPHCSVARSRSISVLAIAGARMNRICCCRFGYRTTAPPVPSRRRRPNRHRSRGVRENIAGRNMSSRARAPSFLAR